MKSIFSKKLELIKIPFSIRKLTIFFILILIYMREYELNTKKTYSSDYEMILLKIEISCDRYFSCGEVFYSIVQFSVVK